MPRLPRLDVKRNRVESPHVFILGAGASYAALPKGDKHGRKLPLMNDLVDVLDLRDLIETYGAGYDGENFEAAYDAWVLSGEHPELIEEVQHHVETYFGALKLPEHPTIYDYLVLSLRAKDVIATFNWDPFLAQAYQRSMHCVGHENMPRILFLHGNVSIGICNSCRTKGWRQNSCDQCGGKFEPSQLLYPVSNKDYATDPFLANEWAELRTGLEEAYLVTVFGYSAPVTDAAARQLLLDAWQNNETNTLAEFDIIDTAPRHQVTENWAEFITDCHSSIFDDFFRTYVAAHPRRSCDAFGMATLQQSPWADNHMPRAKNLEQLQQWISPLITEENSGYLSGNPIA